MGALFAPALRITGRSAASGSWPSARCTAFCTSVAATSTSRPASNSSVIDEHAERRSMDSMLRIASIPFSTSSSGCVSVASTVSGLAPA